MKKTIILLILFLVFSFLHSQHSVDFETGDFSSLDWQLEGDEDWLVTSYQPFAGHFCAQTGYLYEGLFSSLSISMETSYIADISFYWKSNMQFDDKLIFYGAGNNQSSIVWDGTDGNNQPVSSGIYFYRLQTDNLLEVRKMVLLRYTFGTVNG